MSSNDPFDLERFVKAQEPVFDTALQELKAGHKRTHWMWFIFPQLKGLGHSPTAQFYGIASIEEARAYLAHPVLGPRITLCTQVVSAHERQSLAEIFGSPDDLKFVSSMTLFAAAAGDGRRAVRTSSRPVGSQGRADLGDAGALAIRDQTSRVKLATPPGLEPGTYCLEGSCSIQLSYGAVIAANLSGSRDRLG